MIRHFIKLSLPVIVLVFVPAIAYADAGTPLIWAGAFHLVFGNAVIGIAEGLILALLFRQRRAPCIVMMIAANYFSAWIGGVFFIPMITASVTVDLYSAWRWLWCMVAITFVITLALEWPFVALCLRKCDGWFGKSIWGSLIAQSASYLVLFGWYWVASGTTLYTDLAIVQPSAISLRDEVVLYYMAENNDDVYARDLGQEHARRICELPSSDSGDRLYLRESRAAAGHWDLIVGAEPRVEPPNPSPSGRVVSAGLTCVVAEPPLAGLRPGGVVPRFRVDKSGWQFCFGWMAGRLDGVNEKEGRSLDVSLDTPFLAWPVRCPTQLASGQVVFQLGGNQICIVDPNERKIALLAKGRWPVVTMKSSSQ